MKHFAASTVLALSLAAAACQSTTAKDSNLAAYPTYDWRGTLVDSATGQGIGGIVASVRERSEHIAKGWNPYVSTGLAADGRFEVIYYLRVYPCSAYPDTILTLHLDFVDPSGVYAPTTHQSNSFRVCPRTLPPLDSLPLNLEQGLRIALLRQ